MNTNLNTNYIYSPALNKVLPASGRNSQVSVSKNYSQENLSFGTKKQNKNNTAFLFFTLWTMTVAALSNYGTSVVNNSKKMLYIEPSTIKRQIISSVSAPVTRYLDQKRTIKNITKT